MAVQKPRRRIVELAEDDYDRFAEIPEAAARLTIHPETAWQWIKDGRFPIPVKRIGNKQVVSLRHLVDFINSTEAAAS